MGTKVFFLAFTAFLFFTSFLSVSQIISHKEFTLDVISSNNEVKTLTAGYDRNASDEVDSSFGEVALPAYVHGQFDARFRLPDSTTTAYKDFRLGCWTGAHAYHTIEWVNSDTVLIKSGNIHLYESDVSYVIFSDFVTDSVLAEFRGFDTVFFKPPTSVSKIKMIIYYNILLSPPYYHFVFPQGGEVFQVGTVIDIKFDSFLSYPSARNDLFFSSDNGTSWDYIGATPTQFDSIYSWTIPSINSDKCKIRVGDYPCVYAENTGTFTISTTVPVEVDLAAEKSFNLSQNYPNPFNPVTTISYSVHEFGLVNITIFDMLGRNIKTLVNKVQNPGEYSVPFDASQLSGGVYYYRITTNENSMTRKMILLK
ncbi:MAG: T9SS type A sorting domain-containing protein [Ignavibacteriaceae bacterium]|jgi:hypothetical protein